MFKEEPLIIFAVRLHLMVLELSLSLSSVIHKVIVDCLVVQAGPFPFNVYLLGLIASYIGDERG